MIVLAACLIGAGLGVRSARKAGGIRADQIQYGLAGAIAGGLAGLIVTVVIENIVS